MPTARAYMGVAVVSDVFYAIGGYDGTNWLSVNEQYKPAGYGTVAPKVQITSPENKTYTSVLLGFIENRGAAWTGYSLDDKANITITGETKLTNLTQGAHSITVFANDSLGNMGFSDTVFFFVDVMAPNLNVISPHNQSYDASDVQLTFTADEATPYLAYSLDDQPNMEIIGNLTLPALSSGSHRVTLFATDEMGNSAETTVYFNIAPFPMVTVAAVSAIVTIVLAGGFLFIKRRKTSVKKDDKKDSVSR
jgi:hypothetical protein